MKRLIISTGLICAAAFALTDCNKLESDRPATGNVPFEITASTPDTKTANDGFNTTWATGDALNVFHAEAGGTSYGTNDEFTFTADNTFSGTLTEALGAGKSYDWYALYPYNSYVKTPAATSGGYTYIGDSRGVTQDGNSSTAHLIGSPCPLYGVSKSISASEKVSLTMHHLTSVVKIGVTNANSTPLKVSSISFTAPETEDIIGSFYINFADPSNIVYTSKSGSVYSTATLTVSNGEEIAQNATAYFYIPIKPFKAASGSTLKISVNGYEKPLTLSADKEFKAGYFEAVTFNYDKAPVSGTTVSLNIGDYITTNSVENQTKISSIALDEVISASASSGTNNGKMYTSGKDWRFYQNDSGTLTITAAEGHSLKVANIAFSSADNGTLIFGETTVKSGTDITLSGNSAVFSVGSSGTKTNGKIKITSISVTYE